MDRQEAWYKTHLPLREQRIVDVGANVGRLSQFFWDHSGRTSTIVSVEPLPDNVKVIEKRIRDARAGSKWTVKKCAISAHDGHLAMRAVNMSWGLNGIVQEAKDSLTIACRRLESLAPDATVVKVDVEGHEHVFLPQAVRALTQVRTWAIELHCIDGKPLEETLGLFAEAGFRLISAGTRGGLEGPWVDVELTPAFTWEKVPGLQTMRDGKPSTFKMLHFLALR